MKRLDHTRRQEAIEAGWRAYRERVPHLEDAYRNACDEWGISAVMADDEVIGCLMHLKGVVHIGIVPEWRGRWATRSLIREICALGTSTKLLGDETEQREFVRRFFRIEGIEPCLL